ncbi:MAG: amino acid permease [Bacteroidetes bacterium]|nr:amino acid permease [Bacteroidota bacterium]
MQQNKKSFGTAPVFFTSIATILGAILFLRFGFSVGTIGPFGTILVIILAHLVTIPTALAISEIATNRRVEGGGEYFIISRSFGLNIGATIGFSLYLSQSISVAFYVIAFTEAFTPLFFWIKETFDFELPRQAISLPAMALLSAVILKRGAKVGMKVLYVVVGVLFLSIALFFLGSTEFSESASRGFPPGAFKNMDQFFIVFAILFPAFTGLSAGVGLSGDLKNPAKSIPLGTISATVLGMVIYLFITWKLSISASPEDLANDQLVMSKIAVAGRIFIPLGLAASTFSSALGAILAAPRKIQALGADKSFPSEKFNNFVAKGKGETNEPFNGTLITCVLAFVFVALGDVNSVAKIITMFFMVTYGALCLISFLYHFGADPSYRPVFRSRWYISLIGFLMSLLMMFMISTIYTILAIGLMIVVYLYIRNFHKDREGLESIFLSVFFQISHSLQVYLQKSRKLESTRKWRPSVVCVSHDSFERETAFSLLNWVSYKHGFGTYIHLIKDYYSHASQQNAKEILEKLIKKANIRNNKFYIDTIISPSFTSAIAQIIQLPGISGMENNTILFEFDKNNPENLNQIIDNYSLCRSGNYDICILGSVLKPINFSDGIHIWIRRSDYENANLMILLSYVILSHPDWKKSSIKIFEICDENELEKTRKELVELINKGRLPISTKNIKILKREEEISNKEMINKYSENAGLTVVGFRGEQLKHDKKKLFMGYDKVGNILFVNAHEDTEIE